MCLGILNYSGGWAYVRSKVLLHFDACPDRQSETARERLELANIVADRITSTGHESQEDRVRR